MLRLVSIILAITATYQPYAATTDFDSITASKTGQSALDAIEAMRAASTQITDWADTKVDMRENDAGKKIAYRVHRDSGDLVTGLLKSNRSKGLALSHWINGRMHGPFAEWHADGTHIAQGWANGGAWPLVEILYHPNGQIKLFAQVTDEGQFSSSWDENGSLISSRSVEAQGKSSEQDPPVDHRPEAWRK